MKELLVKFIDYSRFHPEVMVRAALVGIVVLLVLIGVMFANMAYYKDGIQQLSAEQQKAKEQIFTLESKLKVMETNYYGMDEDYTIFEKGIAKDYAEKLAKVKRVNGVKKNVTFINHLSRIKLEPDYVELIAGAFYDASLKYDMDSRELIATAWHESRFIRTSESVVGALGVMQVMPLWLKNDAFVFVNDIYTTEDLLDPVKNIHAGAYIYNHYKNYWKSRGYKKDLNIRRLALLSYNRGHNRVSNLMRDGVDPANGYFKVISKKYKKLIKLEETMI